MKMASPTPAQIKSARIFAITVLDDYCFSLRVIATALNISPKSVQRYRERLIDRPEGFDEDQVANATAVAVICMYRSGIRVPIMMRALNVNKDFIYGTLKYIDKILSGYSLEQRGWYANSLVNQRDPQTVQLMNEESRFRRRKLVKSAEY